MYFEDSIGERFQYRDFLTASAQCAGKLASREVPSVAMRVVTVRIRQQERGGVRGDYQRYRSCSGVERNTPHTARFSFVGL